MIDKRKVYRLYTQEIMEYRHIEDKIALSYSPVSFREPAVVKWVKKVQDDFYIAGMMFG